MRLGAVTHPGGLGTAPGHSWRDYRLLERIGKGGAGEVWKAEAAGGFLVALKFVPLAGRLGGRELRSLEILRAARHPNLVVTFGAWPEDELLVIAMELADRTLWGRLQEAMGAGLPGVPREELLDSLGDAARAIDYLNAYRHVVPGQELVGIQHRDIKPQNLLLVGGGTKVADLGVARMLDRSVIEHTGSWSFAYAPPEFFRNRTTRSSDQYSLAVTYCQLRTGRLPFPGTLAEIVLGQLMSPPELSSLDEPERPIVERALSKEPAGRWPSCTAFIEALRGCPPGSGSIPELPAADGLRASPGPGPPTPAPMIAGGPLGPIAGPQDDTWVSVPDWHSDPEPPEVAAFRASSDEHTAVVVASSGASEWPSWPGPDDAEPGHHAAAAADAGAAPTDRPSKLRPAALLVAALALAAWAVHASLRPWDRALDAGRPMGGPRPPAAGVAGDPRDDPGPPPGIEDFLDVATPPEAVGREGEIAGLADRPRGEATLGGTAAGPVSDDAARRAAHEPDGPPPPPPPPPFDLRPPADLDDLLVTLAPRFPRLDRPGIEADGGPGESPQDDPASGAIEGDSEDTGGGPAASEGEGDSAPDPEEPGRPAEVQHPPTDTGRSTPPDPAQTPPAGPGGEDGPGTPIPGVEGLAGDAEEGGPDLEGPVDLGRVAALNDSGLAHFLGGRPAEAIADLDAALAIDPRHVGSLKNRGAVHWHEGRPAEAIADFDAALAIDPDDAVALNNRGLAYRSIGDLERAIADYGAAILLQPEDAVLYYNRAQALVRSGRDAEAIDDLSRAIRLDPGYAKALQARGEALARRGDRAGAEADLARARAIDPAGEPD